MDTWYATKDVMLQIEKFGKIYYCPLKDNRQVDDSGGEKPYQRVVTLNNISQILQAKGAVREKSEDAQKYFESVSKMAVDPEAPPELQELGKVLRDYMAGVKNLDLSRLPVELEERFA